MVITSYRKSKPDRIFEERISSSISAYKKYKTIFTIPNEYEGNIWDLTRIAVRKGQALNWNLYDPQGVFMYLLARIEKPRTQAKF